MRQDTQPAPGVSTGPGRIFPGVGYRLGPGDVLEIQVAGRTEVTRTQIVIDNDGSINVPPFGATQVGGLTLAEAQKRISDRARQILKFVDVAVSMVSTRSFEIVVSGEVEKPGAITTSATRRLHEIIAAAGGVTARGSLRRIKVTQGGTQREIDLLRFELAGDLSQNPFAEEGMVVNVPPKGPSVIFAGAVRRPGEYEIGPSGSLSELLKLVGGVAPGGAASAARLTRLGADERKEAFSVDLTKALTPPADIPLHAGDTFYVPPLTSLQDVVEVRGAFVGTNEAFKISGAGTGANVGKPVVIQRVELAVGDRIRDVMAKVGGPAPYADLRAAMVERRPTAGPVQRIPIDLQRFLVDKDESQNVALQNGDSFTLPVAEDRVFVLGEVRNAGGQEFRPDLTLREYVTLAGGLAARAKFKETFVTFRDGKSYAMSQSPPLEPGAVITVPEVSVKWWQDYVQISSVIIGLISAYTGVYILFGGRVNTLFGTQTTTTTTGR